MATDVHDAEVLSEEKALTRRESSIGARVTVEEVLNQVGDIQRLMKEAMKDGEHFGVIPGCGDKPALLKPGAEKIGLLFNFRSEFRIQKRDLEDGHREYEIVCDIISRETERVVGQGVGLASTLESKYRWRKAERLCPTCGKPSVIKGKAEFGGGWLCWTKKDGCGAKWPDGAEAIESQQTGRVENPDIADSYNTVLKMAKKRAHVDAILSTTAASDIFTQDVEDMASQQADQKTPPPNGGGNGSGGPKGAVSTDSILNGKTESATTKRGARPKQGPQPVQQSFCEHGVPSNVLCRECEAFAQTANG